MIEGKHWRARRLFIEPGGVILEKQHSLCVDIIHIDILKGRVFPSFPLLCAERFASRDERRLWALYRKVRRIMAFARVFLLPTGKFAKAI